VRIGQTAAWAKAEAREFFDRSLFVQVGGFR